MFHMPPFFGDGHRSIPVMQFGGTGFSPMGDNPFHQGPRQPRCRNGATPWFCHSATAQQRQWPEDQCCEPENHRQEHPVFGFVHPLVTSLESFGDCATGLEKGYCKKQKCCKQNKCCSGPEAPPTGESVDIGSLSDMIQQIIGGQSETPGEDFISNIVQNVMKNLGGDCGPSKEAGHSSKWRYEIDCSGFRSDNVFVKMANGNLIVKASQKERDRDGSLSARTMEKRVPIPKNVIANQISCKMMPNFVLKVEGPLKHQNRKSESLPINRGTSQQPKTDKPTTHQGFDVKVLPNGAMMFSSFPLKNQTQEGKTLKKKETSKMSKDKMSQKKPQKTQETEQAETTIPVVFTGSVELEPSTQQNTEIAKETDSGVSKNGATETKGGTNEGSEIDDINIPELDSHLETDLPTSVESAECTEESGAYTVELAESDDDADSTSTKDSDNSFVLLPEQENAEPGSTSEVNTTDITNAMQDLAESVSAESTNDQKCIHNEENGANPPGNFAQMFSQAVPGLQNFIMNMNDGNRPTPENIDPQNIAKMISETLPQLQTFISPFTNGAGTAQNNANSTNNTRRVPSESENKDNESKRPGWEEFNVRLEMPLCSPQSIRVTMDDEQRVLNIAAKKDNSAELVHKIIEVPHSVNVAKLRCQFTDGMLNISAPFKNKVDTTNTREIPVNI